MPSSRRRRTHSRVCLRERGRGSDSLRRWLPWWAPWRAPRRSSRSPPRRTPRRSSRSPCGRAPRRTPWRSSRSPCGRTPWRPPRRPPRRPRVCVNRHNPRSRGRYPLSFEHIRPHACVSSGRWSCGSRVRGAHRHQAAENYCVGNYAFVQLGVCSLSRGGALCAVSWRIKP